jgi:DNA-binding winged helix-turn-helix (wHTH) protein
MSNGVNELYEFGPFRLDAAERLLFRGVEQIPLTGKALDVLLLLVRNRSRTVTKEEFMTAVWAGTIVEEANLADNISTLRQVLGDDAREPKYIRTIPRRGYRFVGETRERQETPPAAAAAPLRRSRVALVIGAIALCVLASAAIYVDPVWDPIRSDPRFTTLVEAVKARGDA